MNKPYRGNSEYSDNIYMFSTDHQLDREVCRSLNSLCININTVEEDDSICGKAFSSFRKDYTLVESRALSYLAMMIYCSGNYGNDLKKAKNLAQHHLFS